ncbi:MAG: HEAT repeat domain-containing protein [Chloroflexi bacterium]|nr:HEAT repeat domain-containing protein [Chloroflexota bacterium]
MDQHCTGSTPHPTARQINMPALSAVEMPALSKVEMPALNRVEMQNLLAELTSGDDTRAENSISALTQLGRAVIPALLDLTHAKEADTRWWAVRALAASPHTLTVDLLPLLSDSAPEVRAATALALCTHPHEDAVEALIHALADEDSLTAGLASNALVKIGSPSVPRLLDVMKDAPTGIRILTLRTLSEIRDHRAIPALMSCLGEESAVLQYWAQVGLERLGLDMVYIKP